MQISYKINEQYFHVKILQLNISSIVLHKVLLSYLLYLKKCDYRKKHAAAMMAMNSLLSSSGVTNGPIEIRAIGLVFS